MKKKQAFMLCVAFFSMLVPIQNLQSQEATDAVIDTVVTRKDSSSQPVKRRGQIVEWKGVSLTLYSNSKQREFDNDQIVEFQTQWSKEYLNGKQLLESGQAQQSLIALQNGLKLETRPWAKRIIRNQLVQAYQSLGQHAGACEQFLQILQEDRNTRFMNSIPLPWTGGGANLMGPARQWIKSREPAVQLLGASWLIASPDRAQAISTLEELSRDIDPRIKNLAIAQLWRTRTKVNAKQIEVWSRLVDKMPRDVRAGPYFILADFQARAELQEEALLNLMKIRILYPEQRLLSAAALYRSAKLLHNRNETKKAQTLLSELTTIYPQTLWAQQANQ